MNKTISYTYKKIFGALFALLFLTTSGQTFTRSKELIDKYLNEIEIGKPIEYKNMKLFPIQVNQELSSKNYVTLDEASKKDWLTIKELSSATVNTVEVKNNGKKPILLMTGEIIKGAKQDRMIKKDILLPPNKTWVQVPVFCVEHGRWNHVSPEFKSANTCVTGSVRKQATLSECHNAQGAVWNEISKSQNKIGVSSSTGTMMANYQDENIQEKITDYTKNLKNFPGISENTIGVVVTTGNKIICFDMFANNKLLQKYWNKLLKSYSMDCIQSKKSTINQENIENFINQIVVSEKKSAQTNGLGQVYKLESNLGKGSALVDRSSVVHMDFFLGKSNTSNSSPLNFEARRSNRLQD
ncbi:ARPP-1 family domain-containing protein [Candidatus Dependentiae bacterium]